MITAARIAAAIEVLDQILSGAPAEKALTHWGRTHRFAGSADRAAIRDLVFDGLRGWRSLAALGGSDTGRGIMIGLMRRDTQDPGTIFTGTGHAPAALSPQDAAQTDPGPAVQADLPDWIFPTVLADLGPAAGPVFANMQSRAPVFLRVNLRRATLDMAMANLALDGITAVPVPNIKTALQATHNYRKIHNSVAYLTGLVELQDAASQAAILRLNLCDGQRVLDFCAGGGGKSLAMAALAELQVFAHDAMPRRMVDLPVRAARAGVNIRTLATAALTAQKPFDLVLVDAPCSGSGTWRRTPDAKWRFCPADLAQLVALQSGILEQAAGMVGLGGTLAYATCSMLQVENQRQIQGFIDRHPEWIAGDDWQTFPSGQGDGFYLARLQRRRKQPLVATIA